MQIIKPEVRIDNSELDIKKLHNIERAARTCYKSEGQMTGEFSDSFLRNILKRGHESVIEHEKISVTFIVDRGISHEIVRHRIASYSQESTRYCNYSANKFGSEITVIEPYFYMREEALYQKWAEACLSSERCYIDLIKSNSTPQEARSVLPNSLKTEIVVTYNLREWRHFFTLRCAKEAHPQMRQVTIPLLLELRKHFEVIFEDIPYDQSFPREHYCSVTIL